MSRGTSGAIAIGLATGLCVGGLLFVMRTAGASGAQRAAVARQAPTGDVARGRDLYLTGCVSCHGAGGVGTNLAPKLIGVGAASADFFLSTGRMPAANTNGSQAVRKHPAYDPAQIADLVAYVASLGPGPAIPEVDTAHADVAAGGVLFRANCASCHQSAGGGGALSYGQNAPDLHEATPTQVVEAMRIGPGQMPVFDSTSLSDEQAMNIAAYVEYLRHPENRGGLPLGGFGPVTEGFVALLVGLGGLAAVCVWIVGRRRHLTEAGHG